jgi:hypothetical protein
MPHDDRDPKPSPGDPNAPATPGGPAATPSTAEGREAAADEGEEA